MYTKTDIAALLRRYGLHLRALGKHAAIPFLAVNLLLPVLTVLCLYKSTNPAEDMREVLSYLRIFLPVCCVWHSIMIMKEYLLGTGSEVLFVCKTRSRLPDALLPFLVMLSNSALLFGGISLFVPNQSANWLHLVGVCCFYFGIATFLLNASRSLTLTLMVVLLYTIAAVLCGDLNVQFFPLYYDTMSLSEADLRLCTVFFFLGALALTLLGEWRARRNEKYA